jgi:hypothetical protein
VTTIENYRARYEEQRTWLPDEWTKYEWAASEIFHLTTYDGDLDERFVKAIIEVCKVILERRTFEYIEDEENYIKYILVCQLLEDNHWINWGTSIRGAWFERDERYKWDKEVPESRSEDILDDLEWGWKDDRHKIEKVPFTVENMKALVEFMEE